MRKSRCGDKAYRRRRQERSRRLLFSHLNGRFSYSLSVLKCRADAEDVLSDLLLEVWRCAPSYRSAGKPMAWVITIARNLCRMSQRKRSKFADESIEDLALPDGGALTPEDTAVIKACFGILSEGEREVVILHAAAGLKHREIAEILKQPLSTVISRYNKAVKKLKDELKGAL